MGADPSWTYRYMKNKAGTIAVIIVSVTALLIAAVMVRRMMLYGDRHIDVSRARYPVKGIDISSHNGYIDFEAVAADSVDFVYIKASEGETFRDPKFADNYEAARRAGLIVGAYHFFRFDCEGWRQGRNLLSATDGAALRLPLAIDVEEWGNPDIRQTDAIVQNLRTMVDYLRACGHRVIIYTNKNGYRRLVRDRFGDVGLWLCSFSGEPSYGRGAVWTLWQHSHRAAVRGINGDVDLNTFNGTREQFLTWLVSTN